MIFIREFESLRGLMALWVVIAHGKVAIQLAGGPILPLLPAASHAVDVFFILSGFVICALRDNAVENYGSFITRRFLRLFPAYLVVLIASAAVLSWTESIFLNAPASRANLQQISFAQYAQSHFWSEFISHATLLYGAFSKGASLFSFVS